MSLGGLGNTIQVLSAIFSNGGGAGLKREIIIEGPTGKLILPVTPAKYTVGEWPKKQGCRHRRRSGKPGLRDAES